jgi:hypothetical protein
LLADLVDGTEKLLQPGDSFLYEDTVTYPTPETWELVELNLLEDRDDEFAHFQPFSKSPLHSWLQEGF